MVVRKSDISYSTWRVGASQLSTDWQKPISSQQLTAALAKVKANKSYGPMAAEVLKQAYLAAKAKAKGDPTQMQVSAQIDKAASSLANEKKKGRVNDGYVDSREAALTKGDLAAALYKFVAEGPNKPSAATPAADLKRKASFAKIDQAIDKLMPIIDKGMASFDEDNGPEDSLRAAANAAGLSSRGRAAILTALNGATSRADEGGWPSADEIKGLLTSAQAKLKASDGAQIVDFEHPEKPARSYKDGVVYGIELDRTPAATGMTSRALLAYASTL